FQQASEIHHGNVDVLVLGNGVFEKDVHFLGGVEIFENGVDGIAQPLGLEVVSELQPLDVEQVLGVGEAGEESLVGEGGDVPEGFGGVLEGALDQFPVDHGSLQTGKNARTRLGAGQGTATRRWAGCGAG